MVRRILLLGLCGVALALPARAQNFPGPGCSEVSGRLNEFILQQAAAPVDPFGRIVGTVKGSLQGATTAFLTSLTPAGGGDLRLTINDVIATSEGAIIYTVGAAYWTYISDGFYQVDATLAIAGGTGKYGNATGSLHYLGVGNHIGPGTGQFVQEYRGRLCLNQ